MINRDLHLGENIRNKYKKASRKLSALIGVCTFMYLERWRTQMEALIDSQFGYCLLVWIFCGRKSSNRIHHSYVVALRVFNKDNHSSFENVLKKYRLISFHHRNIHSFTIEIYKKKKNISTTIWLSYLKTVTYKIIFPHREIFLLHSVNIVNYGITSLKYFSEKVWKIIILKIS